jgi:hypothetical protein
MYAQAIRLTQYIKPVLMFNSPLLCQTSATLAGKHGVLCSYVKERANPINEKTNDRRNRPVVADWNRRFRSEHQHGHLDEEEEQEEEEVDGNQHHLREVTFCAKSGKSTLS